MSTSASSPELEAEMPIDKIWIMDSEGVEEFTWDSLPEESKLALELELVKKGLI